MRFKEDSDQALVTCLTEGRLLSVDDRSGAATLAAPWMRADTHPRRSALKHHVFVLSSDLTGAWYPSAPGLRRAARLAMFHKPYGPMPNTSLARVRPPQLWRSYTKNSMRSMFTRHTAICAACFERPKRAGFISIESSTGIASLAVNQYTSGFHIRHHPARPVKPLCSTPSGPKKVPARAPAETEVSPCKKGTLPRRDNNAVRKPPTPRQTDPVLKALTKSSNVHVLNSRAQLTQNICFVIDRRNSPNHVLCGEGETPMKTWKDLEFDTDAIIEGLRPWVECESPTWDAAAVDQMMDLAVMKCAELGATIERIPGTMGLGGSVRATFPHPRRGAPGIMITGHFDTVHPIGTLAENPFRREDGKVFGPGIQDMKGGNFITLEAIRALHDAGIETKLPIVALFTPDEEIGTPATRTLIETEAKRARYVLCPEPSHPDNGVTTGRYAIARFNLTADGKPSHAGADVKSGVSAVRELARRIIEIEEMTTDDCTFSCNNLSSGRWVNCVPSFAAAECLSMAKRQEDLDAGVSRILAMSGERNGVTFSVTRGVTRPVWEPEMSGTMELYETAKSISAEIGLDMPHGSQGGGSDANFTGALGIPSLCSVGVKGAGLHTLNEHVDEDMIVPRTRIMAGLLSTLS